MNVRIFSILIIFPVLFFACKIKKLAETSEKPENWRALNLPADSLWPQLPQWRFFEGRFDLSIEAEGESHTVKGRVRMEQDRSVLINLRPSVGLIDIARLWIRPDSVIMLDLINNVAWLGSTDTFPLNLNTMQSMLLGLPVPLYPQSDYISETDESARVRLYIPGATNMLNEPDLILPAQYVLLDSAKRMTCMEFGRPELHMRMRCELSAVSIVDGLPLALENQISWRAKGRPGNAFLKFTKAEIGKPMGLTLSVPAHFPKKNIRDFSF